MTQHISFDLETLGTGPRARILSIGAVKFDPHAGAAAPNKEADTFYRVIDQEQGGGDIDASTVAWWMRQSQHARDCIFGEGVERVPLAQALVEFSEWLGFTDDLPEGEMPDVHLWQRGDKDALWLTSAYEGMGLKLPFNYWAVSDQRTLCRWVPGSEQARAGTYHNALDDATHQAACVCAAFRSLTPALWVQRKEDGLLVRCRNEEGEAAVFVGGGEIVNRVFGAEADA